MVSSDIVTNPEPQVHTHDVDSKGNMRKITMIIPVDILVKPRIVENINVGQNYSPSELKSYATLFKEFRDIFS